MAAYGDMERAHAGMTDPFGGYVETRRAAEQIDFGLGVFGYVGDEVNAYGYKADVSKIVYSTDFVASNSTIVTVNGVDSAAIVYATSHLATITALVAAVDALAGVECVLDTADTNNLTILIRTKGVAAVATSATTGGAGQPTTVITTGSGQVFFGVARHTNKEDPYYKAGEAMNVVAKDGRIYGLLSTSGAANDVAYIAADGTFANAGIDVGCKFQTNSLAGPESTTIAKVEVAEQVKMTYASAF